MSSPLVARTGATLRAYSRPELFTVRQSGRGVAGRALGPAEPRDQVPVESSGDAGGSSVMPVAVFDDASGVVAPRAGVRAAGQEVGEVGLHSRGRRAGCGTRVDRPCNGLLPGPGLRRGRAVPGAVSGRRATGDGHRFVEQRCASRRRLCTSPSRCLMRWRCRLRLSRLR